MQLIQRSLLLSALYMFWAVFSAHDQELIKLYVQTWVLSCFPAVYRWCGWVGTVQLMSLECIRSNNISWTAGKHDNTQGCTYRKVQCKEVKKIQQVYVCNVSK